MRQIKHLILFAFLLQTEPSLSQVRGIHLSWNKQNTPSDMITITWSDNKLYEGFVKYGTDKSSSGLQASLTSYSTELNLYLYEATLNNLLPHTSHFYQCGSDETEWSDIFKFHTAPITGSGDKFTIGVWGDTQNNEGNLQFEQTKNIIQEMLKFPVRFTIHMGDIVQNGSVVESWKNFFNVSQPINARAPFMPVTGNHDIINDTANANFQLPFPVFFDFFNLPDLNYSFNYGNAHFVAINSGVAKKAETSGTILFTQGSEEYKWLENDLANARSNEDIEWIIIYMHYPLYSFGWSHVAGWQHRITPLLDKYKVDLALSGHRHVYERHAAIRYDQIAPNPEPNLYKNPEGTIYITNGSSGGSLQGLGGKNMPSIIYTSDVKMHNYAIMTIEKNILSYDVYNSNSEKVDNFKIVKY